MAAGAKPAVLAVDLDGTLLRTDLLYESFWASARNLATPLVVVRGLVTGRAQLKQALATRSGLNVAMLPYDDRVIERIKAWRDNGGKAALVTASDIGLARQVADHLGIFDEVHGSDGTVNLKGRAKAAFLVERFGKGGYAYIGDHKSDLPVWESAGQIICVEPGASLRGKLDRMHSAPELIERERSWRPYLKALRLHQWLKNILVFLPLMAAHRFDQATIVQSIIAFFAFGFIASSVYVINDLLDLAADRAHPRKRKRPFASGAVPIAHGTGMTLGLIAIGGALASLLGIDFILAMLGYYALTMAYSLELKRRAIVDICALATLYVLRIVAGAAATHIPLSVWLLAFALFFFFSLATVKRQAELVDAVAQQRLKADGRGYWPDDLSIVAQMATASGYVSVLVLALYVNSREVVALYSHPETLWGVCIILLYWISRMVMLTHRGHMHDDPIVFAAKDRNSYVCGLIVMVLAVAGI